MAIPIATIAPARSLTRKAAVPSKNGSHLADNSNSIFTYKYRLQRFSVDLARLSLPAAASSLALVAHVKRHPISADLQAGGKTRAVWTALRSMRDLRMHGYQVEQGESNCIVVMRNGHAHGLWHYSGGCYHYTPASYGQPTFKSANLEFVIRHMRELLVPPHDNSRHAGCERRRHERSRVDWPGVLCTTGDHQIILVEDVSAGGLGIRAVEGLLVGDPVGVELSSGFHLTGRVARLHGNKIGFAHRYPLGPSDPLVMAAKAAAR
jgi:hypothetical protein